MQPWGEELVPGSRIVDAGVPGGFDALPSPGTRFDYSDAALVLNGTTYAFGNVPAGVLQSTFTISTTLLIEGYDTSTPEP